MEVDDFIFRVAVLIFNIGMIFAPTIGYISQIRAIYASNKSEGFAPLVSIILLLSNSLRCFYWVGNGFAEVLLFQALWMIFIQLLLFALVLNVKKKDGDKDGKNLHQMEGGISQDDLDESTPAKSPHSQSILLDDKGLTEFWSFSRALFIFCFSLKRFRLSPYNWLLSLLPAHFLYSYAFFIVTLGFFLFLLTLVLPIGPLFVVIGYIALAIEATLLIPQVYLNYTRGSTAGLTFLLIATWIGGDIIKMVFFVLAGQPTPFILCGIFQLLVDFVLVIQLFLY